jgi:hypothetical protein
MEMVEYVYGKYFMIHKLFYDKAVQMSPIEVAVPDVIVSAVLRTNQAAEAALSGGLLICLTQMIK